MKRVLLLAVMPWALLWLACPRESSNAREAQTGSEQPVDPNWKKEIVAPLASADVQELIDKAHPKLWAKSSGKKVEAAPVDSPASASGDAMKLVLEAFLQCDAAYKMDVSPDDIQQVSRKEDHVRLRLAAPIKARVKHWNVANGFDEIILPLSGKWSSSGWTFFYHTSPGGEWFAEKLNAPDPQLAASLRKNIAALVGAGAPAEPKK